MSFGVVPPLAHNRHFHRRSSAGFCQSHPENPTFHCRILLYQEEPSKIIEAFLYNRKQCIATIVHKTLNGERNKVCLFSLSGNSKNMAPVNCSDILRKDIPVIICYNII